MAKKKYNFVLTTIIILLCVILILQVTEAWFTDSKKVTIGGGEFRFGSLGNLDVTATDGVWLDAEGNAITDRTTIMPGDRLTGATFKVSYSDSGTDDVYYVIESNGKYYSIVNSNLVQITDGNALVLTQGETLEVKSAVVTVTIDGNTYSLDGSTSSASIPNAAQGKEIIMQLQGATYTVKIIQKSNLTSEKAYKILTESENIDAYNGRYYIGTIGASNGYLYDHNPLTNFATDFLLAEQGDVLSVDFTKYKFRVCYYDSDYKYIERTSANQSADYTITRDGFIRVVFYVGEREATDEDIQNVQNSFIIKRKSTVISGSNALLEKFFDTGSLHDTDKRAQQAACSDGTYLYYTVVTPNDSSNTYLYKLNIATKQLVKTANNHSYEHANGMTYKDGYLYINGASSLYKVNAETLEYDSTIDMSHLFSKIPDMSMISSIAYNKQKQKFVIRYNTDNSNNDRGIAILDSSFQLESYFVMSYYDSNTGPSIDSVGNYIYLPVFRGRLSGMKSDFVYIIDFDGNLVKKIILYNNNETESSSAIEIESVVVLNDKTYFFYLETGYQSATIWSANTNDIF